MSVHARSDLAAVTLSAAHGGCGNTHVRPAPGGVPDAIWTLTCPACEDHLRHDPTWSATLSELPETYDEEKARSDFDKRGAKDRDQVLALALAKLAGVELPESLVRPITGNMPRTASGDSDSAALHQRIAELEKALTEMAHAPPPAAAPAPAPAAAVTVTPPPAPQVPSAPQNAAHQVVLPSNTKMRNMKGDELAALAKDAGLDASGTRAQVLDRLIASKGNGS